MIQLGNTYIPDIKAISMYHIMNEVDLEELGYIIPKQKPTAKVFVADNPKGLQEFRNWYKNYIVQHKNTGTINSIKIALA